MAVLCGGCNATRGKIVPKAEAMHDQRVMQLRIVTVLDNSALDHTREFNVSHVIDADVLDGPKELIGKPIVLPYDQFYVAKPPPQVGDIVVTTPAAWVTRNQDGKARGFGQ